jgi:hypothetical protein
VIRAAAVGAAVSFVAAASVGAQSLVPEGRLDAIVSSMSAVHAGAGVTTSLGTYLRSGLVAGAGVSRDGLSGRVDLVNRFHLDPFRESRWAPYAGGGLTARFDEGHRPRAFLLLLVGIDGPVKNGLTTSIEAGLGGGGRLGVIVRRTRAERR